MLQDPTDDLLGGRIRLRQLIDTGALPYRDPRRAVAFLDRLGVPFIVACRQRHYRRIDILRAINQSESRQPPTPPDTQTAQRDEATRRLGRRNRAGGPRDLYQDSLIRTHAPSHGGRWT
jgi:hypothetical protein